MFTITAQERTADGATVTTIRINWKPIIIIAVALLVVGGMIGYLVSQRSGETIRISAQEQRINEKVLRNEPLTPAEQAWLEGEVKKSQEEILRAIGQPATTPAPIAKPAPTGTAAPAPAAKAGSWTKTFELKYGLKATIKYVETASAKDKVVVWMDVEDGGLFRNIQNTTNPPSPIKGRWTFVTKDNKTGKVVDTLVLTRELRAGETFREYMGGGGGETIETWLEVQ